MNLSRGELFYYGGMIGIAVAVILSVMLIIVFRYKNKVLMKKIEEEF